MNTSDMAHNESGGKFLSPTTVSAVFCIMSLISQLLKLLFWEESLTETTLNAIETFQVIALYYAAVFAAVAIYRRFRPLQTSAVSVLLCVPALSFLIPYDYSLTESNVLVQINHFMDSSLYARDLLVESSRQVGGYTFFGKLYSFLPMDWLPEAFYLSWLLSLASIALFFHHVFRNIVPTQAVFTCTVICMTVLALTCKWQEFGGFILGDNDLIYPFFRHQTLAWAVGLWALYAYLRRRHFTAGVLLGIVINVHINTGQHLLLALLACFLVDRERDFWRFAATVGTAFLVGSYTLVPVFLNELFKSRSDVIPGAYVLVSAYFRHPHHLIPSSWPWLYHFQYFIFLVIGFSCWIMKPDKTRLDRQLAATLVMALAGLGCGYIFVEIIPVDFAAKTQLARFTILTKVILLLYIVQSLIRVDLGVDNKPEQSESRGTSRQAARFLAPLVLCSLLLPLSQRHKIREKPLDNFHRFFVEQTSTDSLVLLPPTNQFPKFGDLAKRSAVVNYKTMPFTSPYYQTYYERLLRSAGFEVKYDKSYARSLTQGKLADGYHAQSAEALLELRKEYGFDYVVRLYKYGEFEGLDKVYSDKNYNVYRIP